MKYTKEQNAILNHSQDKHLVVEAYAGCTKSTTKIALVNQMPTNMHPGVLVTSHNKHIVVNDSPFMPKEVKNATLHSLGMSMLYSAFRPGDYYLVPRKYEYILYDVLKEYGIYEQKDQREYLPGLISLVDKARCHLINPTLIADVSRVIDYHNIELPIAADKAQEMLLATLKRGRDEANRRIDYTDQIWLPCVLQIPYSRKFHTAIGDEWQDANAAHIALFKIVAGKARVVILGDSNQAIYQFSGADGSAIEKMHKHYRADVLPLSICFRCPKTHLDMARKIVPGIRNRPGAPVGQIIKTNTYELFKKFRPKIGEAFICRTARPLVHLAHSFIEQKIPVHFVGRDLCVGMIDIVDKVCGYGRDQFDHFGMLLEKYKDRRINHLIQKSNSELSIASINDRVDSLDILYDAADNDGVTSIPEFRKYIASHFEREDGVSKPGVYMGTIHISKGGEWNKVSILQPDKIRHPKAKTNSELQSEANIEYIAYTRSKDTLQMVEDVK